MEIGILQENTQAYLLMRAATIIKSGGIVVCPTDTVYGVLCNATNEHAVQKVFELKKRPQEKALPIFVSDIAMARRFAYISDAKAKFLERVWPGAVTILFDHKEKLPPVLTGGSTKMGIRIPNSSFLRGLLSRGDFPLAQTSANISGSPPSKTVEEIQGYFTDVSCQPDLIIGGGVGQENPSAIIDFTGSKPLIVRMGMITKRELDELLDGVR